MGHTGTLSASGSGGVGLSPGTRSDIGHELGEDREDREEREEGEEMRHVAASPSGTTEWRHAHSGPCSTFTGRGSVKVTLVEMLRPAFV